MKPLFRYIKPEFVNPTLLENQKIPLQNLLDKEAIEITLISTPSFTILVLKPGDVMLLVGNIQDVNAKLTSMT